MTACVWKNVREADTNSAVWRQYADVKIRRSVTVPLNDVPGLGRVT